MSSSYILDETDDIVNDFVHGGHPLDFWPSVVKEEVCKVKASTRETAMTKENVKSTTKAEKTSKEPTKEETSVATTATKDRSNSTATTLSLASTQTPKQTSLYSSTTPPNSNSSVLGIVDSFLLEEDAKELGDILLEDDTPTTDKTNKMNTTETTTTAEVSSSVEEAQELSKEQMGKNLSAGDMKKGEKKLQEGETSTAVLNRDTSPKAVQAEEQTAKAKPESIPSDEPKPTDVKAAEKEASSAPTEAKLLAQRSAKCDLSSETPGTRTTASSPSKSISESSSTIMPVSASSLAKPTVGSAAAAASMPASPKPTPKPVTTRVRPFVTPAPRPAAVEPDPKPAIIKQPTIIPIREKQPPQDPPARTWNDVTITSKEPPAAKSPPVTTATPSSKVNGKTSSAVTIKPPIKSTPMASTAKSTSSPKPVPAAALVKPNSTKPQAMTSAARQPPAASSKTYSTKRSSRSSKQQQQSHKENSIPPAATPVDPATGKTHSWIVRINGREANFSALVADTSTTATTTCEPTNGSKKTTGTTVSAKKSAATKKATAPVKKSGKATSAMIPNYAAPTNKSIANETASTSTTASARSASVATMSAISKTSALSTEALRSKLATTAPLMLTVKGPSPNSTVGVPLPLPRQGKASGSNAGSKPSIAKTTPVGAVPGGYPIMQPTSYGHVPLHQPPGFYPGLTPTIVAGITVPPSVSALQQSKSPVETAAALAAVVVAPSSFSVPQSALPVEKSALSNTSKASSKTQCQSLTDTHSTSKSVGKASASAALHSSPGAASSNEKSVTASSSVATLSSSETATAVLQTQKASGQTSKSKAEPKTKATSEFAPLRATKDSKIVSRSTRSSPRKHRASRASAQSSKNEANEEAIQNKNEVDKEMTTPRRTRTPRSTKESKKHVVDQDEEQLQSVEDEGEEPAPPTSERTKRRKRLSVVHKELKTRERRASFVSPRRSKLEFILPRESLFKDEDGLFKIPTVEDPPDGYSWDGNVGCWKLNNARNEDDAKPAKKMHSKEESRKRPRQTGEKNTHQTETVLLKPKGILLKDKEGHYRQPGERPLGGYSWDKVVGIWRRNGGQLTSGTIEDSSDEQVREKQPVVASKQISKPSATQNKPDSTSSVDQDSNLPKIREAAMELRLNEDGTYRRPGGRNPASYEWDSKHGYWRLVEEEETNTEASSNEQLKADVQRQNKATGKATFEKEATTLATKVRTSSTVSDTKTELVSNDTQWNVKKVETTDQTPSTSEKKISVLEHSMEHAEPPVKYVSHRRSLDTNEVMSDLKSPRTSARLARSTGKQEDGEDRRTSPRASKRVNYSRNGRAVLDENLKLEMEVDEDEVEENAEDVRMNDNDDDGDGDELVQPSDANEEERDENKLEDEEKLEDDYEYVEPKRAPIKNPDGSFRRPHGAGPRHATWSAKVGMWIATKATAPAKLIIKRAKELQQDATSSRKRPTRGTNNEIDDQFPAKRIRSSSESSKPAVEYAPCNDCRNCRVREDCGTCLFCRYRERGQGDKLTFVCAHRICLTPVQRRLDDDVNEPVTEDADPTGKRDGSVAKEKIVADNRQQPESSHQQPRQALKPPTQSIDEASSHDEEEGHFDDAMSDLPPSPENNKKGQPILLSGADLARKVQATHRVAVWDDDELDGLDEDVSYGDF